MARFTASRASSGHAALVVTGTLRGSRGEEKRELGTTLDHRRRRENGEDDAVTGAPLLRPPPSGVAALHYDISERRISNQTDKSGGEWLRQCGPLDARRAVEFSTVKLQLGMDAGSEAS
ncbi:hypothetical protein MRX96_015256 [Rhipicephalus microplus]